MTAARRTGLPPVVGDGTRLLILGSLPGDVSLRAAQYYAHPQNAFWRLIGGVIGVDLSALAYEKRLQAMKARGVGLWDVIASAERSGSLDAAIRAPEAADLTGMISALPNLRAVAFNGATAARIGRRALAGVDMVLINLPSSSAAYTLNFAAKLAAWRALGHHLVKP